jgi:hypothetical protein
VSSALFEATARASVGHDRVLVALDGTSLRLTDRDRTKGFGAIGTLSNGASGLKLMNALAMTWDGVPIGIAEQIWWSRTRLAEGGYRRGIDRESARWRDAVTHIGNRFREYAPSTKLHFLVDREGDASKLIRQLLEEGHEFTLRSNGTRKVQAGRGIKRLDLRSVLSRRRVLANIRVEVPDRRNRTVRVANLSVRAGQVPLILRDRYTKLRRVALLTVVWACEQRGPATGRIEWLLLTNLSANTAADVCDAVRRYANRWRIEDFHRAWKSGICRVEDTQLRSTNAVIKWATILAAVASRAERLKHRSRQAPEVLAITELSADEIEAIVLLRGAKPSQAMHELPLGGAVRMIAELGGYVGAKKSSPPGTATIARGLERVELTAQVIAQLREQGRLR